MNVERQQVYSLVDRLAPSQLAAVRGLLTVMLDPNSTVDDDPETAKERQAIAVANDWLERNEPIPFEEVLADFGLTIEDARNYKEPA